MKKVYTNTCLHCGAEFAVKNKQQSDPNNFKKFKRMCSRVCLSAYRSKKLTERLETVGIRKREGIRTKLCRDDLVRMFSYEHMLMEDIAKTCRVKSHTLAREFERLEIPRVFFRTCPKCGEDFACKMRCMTDPKSNKFKKYCSRACQLSSRNNAGTWIENEVERALISANIRYDSQWEFGRNTIDFYVPDKKIAIEVNGDFWHANPEIYGKTKPLHRYHARVIAKDTLKLAKLREAGIEVMVVWEKDLTEKRNETLKQLISDIVSAA